jgi:hypothetical protein
MLVLPMSDRVFLALGCLSKEATGARLPSFDAEFERLLAEAARWREHAANCR